MPRVTLGEIETDNTFGPRRFVYVGGLKTRCSLNIKFVEDSLASHEFDIKTELSRIIVEELKHHDVTSDEVANMLEF